MANPEPSIEEVVSALQALYVHNVEGASKWLESFQRSVHAWEICDQLLRNSDNETYTYFAANTMKSKIEYSIHELPASAHESLRDALIDHCKRLHFASWTTLTQLCIAIADLAVQMVRWNNVVDSLMSSFGTDARFYAILLEILMLLPEEVESDKLRIGENRRREVTKTLKQSAPVVFHFLSTCIDMSTANFNTCCKTLSCLANWFRLDAIASEQIISSNFLSIPFQILLNINSNIRLYEAASDCLCAVANVVEDYDNHYKLAEALVAACGQLIDGAFRQVVKNNDMERTGCICRIFVELGISLHHCLVETPDKGLGTFNLLEMVLLCSESGDSYVAEITFDFWFCFADALYDKIGAETSCIKSFEPYIYRLLNHFCRLCRRQESEENEILTDDDSMWEFRYNLEDVVDSLFFIVGGASKCYSYIFQHVSESMNSWIQLEATFFLLSILAKSIQIKDAQVVIPTLHVIISNPCGLALKETSLKLLQRLSFVLNEEVGRACVSGVLSYAFASLQTPSLIEEAASTIENICIDCRRHLYPHLSLLLEAIQFISNNDRKINKSTLKLIKGMMDILSNMPPADAIEYLQTLAQLQLEPLNALLQGTAQGAKEKATDPVPYVDRLSNLFRHYRFTLEDPKEVHPCLPLFEKAWPVLSAVIRKYKTEDVILEHTCNCVRYAVRCLGYQAAHLLGPIAEQLVDAYTNYKHSCFLYLSSILVDEFAKDTTYWDSFRGMLEVFCNVTAQLLQDRNALVANPDTVDDFFRFTARYLLRCPVIFLTSTSVNFVIGCALETATIDHKDAHESALIFFCDLIDCLKYRESLPECDTVRYQAKALIDRHGPQLVNVMISSAAGGIRSALLTKVAEVLQKLRDHCPSLLSEWSKHSISNLKTVSETGAVIATPEQLNSLYDSIVSNRGLDELVHDLRIFSRLYH